MKASTTALLRRAAASTSTSSSPCATVVKPRWTCARCFSAARTLRNVSGGHHLEAHHEAIKRAFDEPPPVHALLESVRGDAVPAGRFTYAALREPGDFVELSRRTQRRAEAIVQRILAYADKTAPLGHDSDAPATPQQVHDLRVQVKQVDRLSDLLCGVIDLAELIRNLDVSHDWIRHAEAAYQELCYYMNQLNTHVQLYEALKRVYDPVARSPAASSDPSLAPALTVAAQFLSDFEKSGIHLPDNLRRLFVDLSDQILVLGRTFTSLPETELDSSDDAKSVTVSLDDISSWSPAFAAELDRSAFQGNQITLHANSAEAQTIRREHPDPELRRKFYTAAYRSSTDRIAVLENLLKKRAQLAKLVEKRNYAEVALVDKMAKTPENVMSFLTSLAKRNRPLATNDLRQLQEAKRIQETSSSSQIQAWDRDFYYGRAMSLFSPSMPPNGYLSNFFSVGTCIAGLSALFDRIFGIHFELEKLVPGETWASQGEVVKLAVVDEKEGKIGDIYCDIFARDGKPTGAAHYTVRCSRRLDDDEPEKDMEFIERDNAEGPDYRYTLPLNPQGHKYEGREGLHQMPIVVLTCDFDKPTHSKPGLLAWQEVETLFHEMGHAMHSMIGRTEYHNVAGTRCATDFVELPSILMEHFASSSAVLELFAKHYKTQEPLPIDQLRQLQQALRGFQGLESNSQIFMAILDQLYHGDSALQKHFDSTTIYQMAAKRFGVIPPAEGTSWQTNFGHLFGYGATYYSYLFDRAIAHQVFDKLFKQDPLSRASGERYKQEVLQHGGGRNPWSCIGSVLDNDALSRGDKASMDIVGSWNVDP